MGWHLKSDTFSERRYRRLAGNGKTYYYPDIGAGGWQTTEKSTMKRECFVLRHERSLFLIIMGSLGSKIAVILRSLGSSKSAFKVKTRSLRSNWGHRGHRLGSIWDHWDRIEVIGVRKLGSSGQRLQKSSFFFVRENESKKFL